MRILFVVPYAPSQIRVRPYQLIRSLHSQGHDVTLATSWTTEGERMSLQGVRSTGVRVVARRVGRLRSLRSVLRALPSSWPLQTAFSWDARLYESVRTIAQSGQVDVVHVEHMRGARYALRLADERRAGHLPVPLVWDSVDCMSQLFDLTARLSHSARWRRIARLERPRTLRMERLLVTAVDRVVLTSDRDRDALLRVVADQKPADDADSRCTVVSNGVDLTGFSPHTGNRPPATVTFTGKMSYHANVTGALHLLDQVMPLVWRHRPEVKVQIVGRDPARPIRERARRYGQSVDVTGEVPALGHYLQRSTLAVAPLLYGVGVQNKVLEAMATATPVVATPEAVGGLHARAGHDLVVADGPGPLATAIADLLDDRARRDRVGRAGRAYVERHHRWDDAARSLVTVYEEASADMRSG